jgi:hypothetical protein
MATLFILQNQHGEKLCLLLTFFRKIYKIITAKDLLDYIPMQHESRLYDLCSEFHFFSSILPTFSLVFSCIPSIHLSRHLHIYATIHLIYIVTN